MAEPRVGEDYRLNRKTFLHQGIFVNEGTQVRVMEITEGTDKIIVQFMDREGFPHTLKGVAPEELQ
ncbi:MAG: hypothetical protein K8S54_04955 [Spirochaetia bacterium]|nr:hypothetical protein [Spirochaetia bacterium]